jgi:hypothetical protein
MQHAGILRFACDGFKKSLENSWNGVGTYTCGFVGKGVVGVEHNAVFHAWLVQQHHISRINWTKAHFTQRSRRISMFSRSQAIHIQIGGLRWSILGNTFSDCNLR